MKLISTHGVVGFLPILLAISLAFSLGPPAHGARAGNTILWDSIKDVAATPGTTSLNRTASPVHASSRPFISRQALKNEEQNAKIEFEVALKMRNFTELRARVGRGERISPHEMADKYNPASADYAKVVAWLSSQGFEITRQDKNHLAIFARGKVSQIQNAMQMTFARVVSEDQEYTSGITAPSVPAELSPLILGVNGLQPHLRMRKHLVLKPNSLTGTNPPYLPSQIAQAYSASPLYRSNITGTGQSIAIVIDTFPSTADLTSFWQTYNVKQSINNISFTQVVTGPLPNPSGEETLDTEWSSAMAPGAKVRVYATVALSFTGLDQAYQQIYDDVINHPEYGIHQLSMSYGISESGISNSQVMTDDQYYAELASAGVSIFASSGDSGSTPGPYGAGDESGQLDPQFPASDPHVTSVGGTSLTLDSNGNASSESVWNNSYGASGGGVSQYFVRPSWQTGNGVPTGSNRLVPDVASVADPETGAVVVLQGSTYVFGGTSWSSPMWCGFCALINQNRQNAGLAPVGLLAPAIYPLIGSSSFRDITVGNNATANSGGDYGATAGYDLASGIGVPNVQALATSLMTTTGAPIFTNGPPPANASLGVAYSFTYSTAARPLPTFTVASGGLPPGLTLSSDGSITGTPTQAGTFSGTVSAGNGVGAPATQAFTINVVSAQTPPAFTNGPATATALVDTYYIFTYSASGFPGATFSVGSGALPPGFSLSANGVLDGVPSQTGVYAGTIVASNGVNPNAAQAFSITVQQAPAITNGPPPTVVPINVPFNFTYTVVGEPAPTFSFVGNLPTGVSLSASGVLSGTPTEIGTFTGTIIASNGLSPDANQDFSITVQGPEAPVITNSAMSATINVNATFNFDYTATGTPTPTFSMASGVLPPGLSISSSGAVTGTPTQTGTFTGTVSADNGLSPAAIQNFSIVVQTNIVQQYTSFSNLAGGIFPNSPLVLGPDGNLWGTMVAGSPFATCTGSIFKMTPQGVITVVHQFKDSTAKDGQEPSGLVLGSDGDFYGVAEEGGSNGLGTVFKIAPDGTFTLLYTFGSGGIPSDGANPMGQLVEGPDRNFYGVTFSYGARGNGTVYKITPQGVMTVLYAFGNGGVLNDGANPAAGLALGPDGDFYGTTQAGGSTPGFNGAGTVYKITAQGVVTILHTFDFESTPNDGAIPQSGLLLGSDGYFYGMTAYGGVTSQGTVFKMAADGTLTTLHRFGDGTTANDGYRPEGTLIEGTDGNLYGTTIYGGANGASGTTAGTIFQIAPQGTLRNIHDFRPNAINDGNDPIGGLFQTPDGTLYGTTLYGSGDGTVYELTLVPTPAIIAAPPTAVANAGAAYNFSFQVSGHLAPTYTVSSGALPPGVTLSSSGVLAGTPALGGIYEGTISAAVGGTVQSTQNFSITVMTNVGLWTAYYFAGHENDPSISGPSATPKGDSVPNLVKYLCDIDPQNNMSTGDRNALPTVIHDTTTNPGTDYLAVVFRQSATAADLGVSLESSSDLNNWSPVQSTNLLSQKIGTDSTTHDPIMEMGVKVDGSPIKFIRLRLIVQ